MLFLDSFKWNNISLAIDIIVYLFAFRYSATTINSLEWNNTNE